MRWCPGAGCSRAIERLRGNGGDDAACAAAAGGCGAVFCWACGAEAHRPLSCATVRAWLLKNSAESENMNWILAHTKPCPKCSRPIEKNQGCMHITCQAPCKHEFCWLCTGPWKDHGERTGGFYQCNKFETARVAGEINETVSAAHVVLCFAHVLTWQLAHPAGEAARARAQLAGALHALLRALGAPLAT